VPDDPISPLDAAHAAMVADAGDTAARLRWFGLFLDAELTLLLERDPEAGAFAPRLFALADGPVVLACEGEDRLAGVLPEAASTATLPGRVLVAALAGQGIGIGVNLGADAAWLIDAPAVDWLAQALAAVPEPAPDALAAPVSPPDLPPGFEAALMARLEPLRGTLAAAHLAGDGAGGLVVVFEGAADGPALARMLGEAAAFGGADMAVAALSLPPGVAPPERLRGVARRIDLSPRPRPPGPAAPEVQPRPPRLR
jgi:hypothetical protein